MNELIDTLRSAVQTDLFAGGMALTIIGTALALCRSLPSRAAAAALGEMAELPPRGVAVPAIVNGP